jgi:hypothetical protein
LDSVHPVATIGGELSKVSKIDSYKAAKEASEGSCIMLDTEAPRLVPGSHAEMLQEAEALLELMQSEPPATLVPLARLLASSAHCAGERDIAEAADDVCRSASHGAPIVLTPAIRRLAAAIAQAQKVQAAA